MQKAEIATLVDLARRVWTPVFASTKAEVSIVAVDPAAQGLGIGQDLIRTAEDYIRDQGIRMVMVETVEDSGHSPARHPYEGAGYVPWPVVRYVKPLQVVPRTGAAQRC